MAFATSFIYEAIDKISPVLKEMEARSEKLEKALKDAMKNPKVDAKALQKALIDAAVKPKSKFQKLNDTLDNSSKSLKRMSKSLKGMGDTMNKNVTLPVLAGFTAIILAGGKYEDSLASLSAITGLQGKGLKSLSDEILKTASTFGIAATDIAGGMELIGSKQPALLKTPKILMEVTRAAATLAKASGQDLTTTAGDLLDVMNTFEISGSRATETINILAAASKFGSAQVPFVTSAMKNAGAMAKLTGVSMVQLVASIEIMSEKTGLAAEVIGTGLQTAFKNLEKGPKKFRPSVVGLQKALENMNEAGLNTVKMEKLIGGEAIKSFSALIKNADAFKAMTKNIQGTNVAQDQAEIRMKTFNESIKRLWQNIKNNLITVFMDNKDMLNELVASGMSAIKWASAFIRENKELVRIGLVVGATLAAIGPILIVLSSGLGVMSAAMGVGSTVMGAFALSANTMTAAALPMAAPILALVAALALLYKTKQLLDDEDTTTGIAMWLNPDIDPDMFMDDTGPTMQAAKAKKNLARLARLEKEQNAAMGAKAGGKSTVDVNVNVDGNITSNGKPIKDQSITATAATAGTRGT